VIAPGLNQQFPEPPADGADPALRSADPVADPPPVEPEPAEPTTVDEWRAKCTILEAELRQARQNEPPIKWMRLKPACGACIPPLPYETARKWCVYNRVRARRAIGSRLWQVDFASLQEEQDIECRKA
jgi:hypothetical protein